MTDLRNKKCIPCEGGVPALDISEIHKYQKKVDGWDVKKMKNKYISLKKVLNLKIFYIAKILLIKLVKFQKKKITIQILYLVGDMLQLELQRMP